jgi:pimeloyl-ACP methyl ester carboxylesterase
VANGGTLVLHEIGVIPLELQAKLLCVLQEQASDVSDTRRPVESIWALPRRRIKTLALWLQRRDSEWTVTAMLDWACVSQAHLFSPGRERRSPRGLGTAATLGGENSTAILNAASNGGDSSMSTVKTSEEIDHNRRGFLRDAATMFAAAEFATLGSAESQSDQRDRAKAPPIKPGTHTSFASMKQVDAGLLNVGYAEAGPAAGPVVILLHGWPYDIYSYVDVTPLLASAGYRVIVPYLRGYGATSFLSGDTVRNGQQAVVAVDIIAFMDALKIDKAIVAGFDWGARTANIMAALWPERCKALVSVSGYLIGSPESNKKPLPPKAELAWWYQFYFATDRGQAGYEQYRHDFAKLIWQLASPKWSFDGTTFDRTAKSFDNPDHVAIVIHNYRWRIALANGESQYDDLEKRLAEAPVITAPTITLEGDANGAPHPEAASFRKKFSGKYAHRVIAGGVGHNLPQEAPQAFAEAVIDVDGF